MRFLSFFLLLLSIFIACKSEPASHSSTTLSSPETASESPKTPEKDNKVIVFFGNSLTAGLGLEAEEGFPARIQEKINAENLPYTVVNAGLSGETTSGGLKRVDWVLQQHFDVFVLELGANDALRGQPVATAKQNLEQIIDLVRAKNPQCKVILAGMQAPPNLGEQYASDFQKIYPQIAKNKQVALVPFLLDGVGGIAELNQTDGIHPTAAGQKIVAENVWKVLRPLL